MDNPYLIPLSDDEKSLLDSIFAEAEDSARGDQALGQVRRLRYTIRNAEMVDPLTIAPGDDDLTFGSLLDTMIRRCFERAGSRHAGGLYYMRCHHCNGTSIDRPVGERETRIDLVKHDPNCLVAKHMPRLRAMANKGVT